MFNTTIIKKTITGIMQSSGGYAEPITRALWIRVRTALGKVIVLKHDDTNGTVHADGKLVLYGTSGILISTQNAEPLDADLGNNQGEYYNDTNRIWFKWKNSAGTVYKKCVSNFDATSGTSAQLPANPIHGQEMYDTDLEIWVKYNGNNLKWETNGVAVYEE